MRPYNVRLSVNYLKTIQFNISIHTKAANMHEGTVLNVCGIMCRADSDDFTHLPSIDSVCIKHVNAGVGTLVIFVGCRHAEASMFTPTEKKVKTLSKTDLRIIIDIVGETRY